MKLFDPTISRRSFLGTTAAFPLAIVNRDASNEYRYRYDHVVGTSLDIAVRARSEDTARTVEQTVLEEIRRLVLVLSTRDPKSEISRLDLRREVRSQALRDVLSAYDRWERRTGGALSLRPEGPRGPINVDALGKAYIIDRAVEATRGIFGVESILLNIGGDIRLSGSGCEVDVTHPAAAFDNGQPLTRVWLEDEAIATSGTYARGAHLLDPRTGRPVSAISSATVIARDAVTANALATAACIEGPENGMALIESTPHAVAIFVTREGVALRSSGFARRESPVVRTAALPVWPAGFRVAMSIQLLDAAGRAGRHRPYVGIWAEDPANNKLLRVIAFWANDPRYYNELSVLFNRAGRSHDRLHALARATRPSGKYDLIWDGLDDQMAPVPVGTYRISVETNRENGSYGKQSALIPCAGESAEVKISGTANSEPITVQYGL